MNIRKDLSNQKFGKLTAISPVRVGRYTHWECKCDCGGKITVVGTNLVRGQTQSCGCLRREKVRTRNKRNSTKVGELTLSYFNQVKRNASKRGLVFDVTMEQIWNLFVSQKSKCKLSGMEISFQSSDEDSETYRVGRKHTASLDRIDSNFGYVMGNVQWVHRDINIMKNNFDESYFKQLCQLVSESENEYECTKPKCREHVIRESPL